MILIQNILNGNPQAQEKLYNKYKEKKLLHKYIGSREGVLNPDTMGDVGFNVADASKYG